jgi:phage/plasmid-associated DNA primase
MEYKALLLVDDIPCDDNGIHFKNGRFDLKSGTFGDISDPTVRADGTYCINCLPYDWSPSTPEDLSDICNLLCPAIFRTEEELRYMQYYIGSEISGESVAECNFLMNWGKRQNGKSIIVNILRAVFVDDIYFKSFAVTTLKTDTAFNRSLATMNPDVRFMVIVEIEPKDIKAFGNLKKVCDGNIDLTPYHKRAAIHVNIKGKLIMTSNFFMDFCGDTGVARRITNISTSL